DDGPEPLAAAVGEPPGPREPERREHVHEIALRCKPVPLRPERFQLLEALDHRERPHQSTEDGRPGAALRAAKRRRSSAALQSSDSIASRISEPAWDAVNCRTYARAPRRRSASEAPPDSRTQRRPRRRSVQYLRRSISSAPKRPSRV